MQVDSSAQVGGNGSGVEGTSLPAAVDAPQAVLRAQSGEQVVYYKDTSTPGRPLVLLHSINAAPSAYEMRPLFEALRSKRPVYAPDLPGFGLSDRPDRVYSPEFFASAIKDFLDEVATEPANVVALSLTAEFAARAALMAPERVASLVLISPTGYSKRSLPSRTTSNRVHKALSLPGLSQGLYSLLTVRPSIRYFLGKSFEGETPEAMIDYAYATSHQPGARYAPLYFLSGHLFTANASVELYSKLGIPVLVLHDRDPNLSFDLLPGFLAGHANFKAERISPTLGLPHWEKTTETLAAIEGFWEAGGKD